MWENFLCSFTYFDRYQQIDKLVEASDKSDVVDGGQTAKARALRFITHTCCLSKMFSTSFNAHSPPTEPPSSYLRPCSNVDNTCFPHLITFGWIGQELTKKRKTMTLNYAIHDQMILANLTSSSNRYYTLHTQPSEGIFCSKVSKRNKACD